MVGDDGIVKNVILIAVKNL